MQEFKDCDSVYPVPNKQDEDDISSEGEFNDAKQMQIYPEDATEVYLIEQRQNYQSNQIDGSVPQNVLDMFTKQKKDGAKATRNRELKHFNKVGYSGFDQKPIPRWAADAELTDKIARHQGTKANLAT